MPRLDPSVTIHKLNLDPNTKRIMQKKRIFIAKRQKAITKEVKKFKAVGFIKEV